MSRWSLGLLVLVLFAASSALAATPLMVPVADPVDGVMGRGDQAYPIPSHPAVDGHFDVDGIFEMENLRWGFERVDKPEGTWRSSWGPGRIDVRRAKSVTFLLSPFSPEKIAGHGAMLIEFDGTDAIKNPQTGAVSSGLVVSVEMRMRPGDQFGFWTGMFGNRPRMHVLSTWEDYQQSLQEVWKGRLQRWRLNLSPDQCRKVAHAVLDRSLAEHRTAVYVLTRASCVTGAVDFLNEGLAPADRIVKSFLCGLIARWGVTFPARFPSLLTRLGHVDERLPDLEPIP